MHRPYQRFLYPWRDTPDVERMRDGAFAKLSPRAQALFFYLRCVAGPKVYPINPPESHAVHIAAALGGTRETAQRALRELAADNWITVSRLDDGLGFRITLPQPAPAVTTAAQPTISSKAAVGIRPRGSGSRETKANIDHLGRPDAAPAHTPGEPAAPQATPAPIPDTETARLVARHCGDAFAARAYAEYGERQIETAAKAFQEAARSSRVRSPSRYLQTAIRNAWQPDTDSGTPTAQETRAAVAAARAETAGDEARARGDRQRIDALCARFYNNNLPKELKAAIQQELAAKLSSPALRRCSPGGRIYNALLAEIVATRLGSAPAEDRDYGYESSA